MMDTNTVTIEIGNIENFCFIVMPFDSLFQVQYERVIRPAIEELGLICIRADELYSRPQVMADIWKSIRKSRLVIAELTGRNANVFYEIGLAHAIGKPIILLTRNEDDVPFDLKAGANQPIWVDLLVPQTAAAGQYSGFYTVTSDQGKTTGPIALTVWNFALPTTPSLKSSFLFSQAGTVTAQQELLRHRISPSSTRPADLPLMAGRGLNAYLLKSTMVAALGGLLFGFDTAVIAGTTAGATEYGACAARLPVSCRPGVWRRRLSSARSTSATGSAGLNPISSRNTTPASAKTPIQNVMARIITRRTISIGRKPHSE